MKVNKIIKNEEIEYKFARKLPRDLISGYKHISLGRNCTIPVKI